MNSFSACLAFGPMAVYLVLLGLINLSSRPVVITGTRETLALALALSGLIMVGPMQLFMPQEAALQFGELVWLLLLGFYGLSVSLVIMLSRPRLVVFNVTLEQLRRVVDEAARRIDPAATWAGDSLYLPRAKVQLRLDDYSPLCNVSLLASGPDQSPSGWRGLEHSLRGQLLAEQSPGRGHGQWLTLVGLAILGGLTAWVVNDPQNIVHGLSRWLQP